MNIYFLDMFITPPSVVTAMIAAGLTPGYVTAPAVHHPLFPDQLTAAAHIPRRCYIRADIAEASRPDYSSFPAGALGNVEPSSGNKYVDIRNAAVRSAMAAVRGQPAAAAAPAPCPCTLAWPQQMQPSSMPNTTALQTYTPAMTCSQLPGASLPAAAEHHVQLCINFLLPACALQRVEQCASKGFQLFTAYGTDSYTASTGFPLTVADAKSYTLMLGNLSQSLGMTTGLVQTTALLTDSTVFSTFDFAVRVRLPDGASQLMTCVRRPRSMCTCVCHHVHTSRKAIQGHGMYSRGQQAALGTSGATAVHHVHASEQRQALTLACVGCRQTSCALSTTTARCGIRIV